VSDGEEEEAQSKVSEREESGGVLVALPEEEQSKVDVFSFVFPFSFCLSFIGIGQGEGKGSRHGVVRRFIEVETDGGRELVCI